MFPERTWVMVDGIYRYNFMEKIYTGIYNNRFEHLLPVQTVPVLGQVKKLSLSRGKRLYSLIHFVGIIHMFSKIKKHQNEIRPNIRNMTYGWYGKDEYLLR